MTDYQQRGETFSVLGSKYDLFEGIYGPADWKRLCQFLELDIRSPEIPRPPSLTVFRCNLPDLRYQCHNIYQYTIGLRKNQAFSKDFC